MVLNFFDMKKMVQCFTVLLFIVFQFCYAQNHFETLISWGDTSVSGLYAREMPDSSFLLLSNNQYFYPGPGILIEGPPTYGTGLIKISQDGAVEWKQLYNNVSGGKSILPAASFFPVKNSIIIPFLRDVGLLFCDSIPGTGGMFSFSYKTGITRANNATGTLMDLYLYSEDSLCSTTTFRSFATINDSTTIAIETAGRKRYVEDEDESYVSVRTIPDSLVSQYSIDTNYSIEGGQRGSFAYNRDDTSFTISAYYRPASSRRIIEINSKGEIKDVFNYQIPRWHYTYYFEMLNGAYYFMVEEIDSMHGGIIKSYVLKYSEGGVIERQFDFYDSRAVDLELTPDGQILLLCDKSKGNWDDSISEPVRVYLLDEDLGEVKYRDFGFPYVNPSHITTTSDNGFLVTGTSLKDIIDEAIREPSQIYFLKSHIDSINLVWTSVPTEFSDGTDVRIYPNPCSEKLITQFEVQNTSMVQCSIYDYTGKRVRQSGMKQLIKGSHAEEVNLAGLPNGMYIIMVSINGRKQALKVIKTNADR